MTCYSAEVGKPGELIIHYALKLGQAKDFVLTYNHQQMQPAIEKIKLEAPEDKGIIMKWGDTIYRINFQILSPKTSDKLTIKLAEK
ncbi:hypothetical protein [Spirosoma jeollabukense]